MPECLSDTSKPAPHKLIQACAAGLLAILLIAAFYRLSQFPGLHADEAWFGLRALDIAQNGFFSLHGMNPYTGALFPELVAATFSLTGANVFGLRLLGALLNWAALGIAMATFWNRGTVAFHVVLLFASSLLFLFFSRVAWEVCALENFLLALIVFALSKILPADRPRVGHALLFFAAFALGTWNHFIFLTAALSLPVTALFLSFKIRNAGSLRVLFLSALNLFVQAMIYFGKPPIADGDFLSHAMPALLVGFALLLGASFLFVRVERRVSAALAQSLNAEPVAADRASLFLILCVVAGLIFTVRQHLTSFFGMLSGVVVLERVASYPPQALEVLVAFVWAAVLIGIFVVFFIHEARSHSAERDPLRTLLLIWPAVFLAIFQFVTGETSDRYYLIPIFLFLIAIALSLDEIQFHWRRAVEVVLILGFVQAQFFFWSEATRAENRLPLDFQFGPYRDTSRHFLKLGQLEAFFREQGLCKGETSTYFIGESLLFLQKSQPLVCHDNRTAHVEYCDTCQDPVPWFQITYR